MEMLFVAQANPSKASSSVGIAQPLRNFLAQSTSIGRPLRSFVLLLIDGTSSFRNILVFFSSDRQLR
jgi:hypothetical protein